MSLTPRSQELPVSRSLMGMKSSTGTILNMLLQEAAMGCWALDWDRALLEAGGTLPPEEVDEILLRCAAKADMVRGTLNKAAGAGGLPRR